MKRPAGYTELIRRYELDVIQNWHLSYVTDSNTTRRLSIKGDTEEEVFPSSYWPGKTLGDHLEFALKYDGTNLAILSSIFNVCSEAEFLAYIRSKPGGKYVRRLWFIFEFLKGKMLPLDDLKTGNYVDLLDSDRYYSVSPGKKIRRQRINNNLPGDNLFCPTIRRTDKMKDFESANLTDRCKKVISEYPPELLRRATSYLYRKETKSSFEIENIVPGSTRTEHFVNLLESATGESFVTKKKLVEAQNQVVDPRFRESDYRHTQNYVGETISLQREKVHYVSPRPEDLPGLMEGLVTANQLMKEGNLHPVVQAASTAYGFVFLHPFEDGNGRIHRFLIHNILALRGFTPEGILFPVSAAMIHNIVDYDNSLEAFSRPLLNLLEYSLDENGEMTVYSDSCRFYRYIDMTPQAEALFGFIEETIDEDLRGELAFLANYDKARKDVSEVVDMPDRLLDLFIRLCMQNKGRISARKRESHFDFLTDEELSRMENALRASYGNLIESD
ncbi:MAG: Fic family protein [Actinobacteria bacterium]|nr:Fic family protein [Actinomycetota bacterium]